MLEDAETIFGEDKQAQKSPGNITSGLFSMEFQA